MKKLDIKLTDGEFENPLKEPINSSEQLYGIFRGIKDFAQETLFVIYLHEDFTGVYDIHSHGPAALTLLSIKDLLGRGYMLRAKYFILAHNHPSGIAKPSDTDKATLKYLETKASAMVDLQMLDFMIIGDNDFWCWRENEHDGIYNSEEPVD